MANAFATIPTATPFKAPARAKAVVSPTPPVKTLTLPNGAEAMAQNEQLAGQHAGAVKDFTKQQAAAEKAAFGSGETFAGFNVKDISSFFGNLTGQKTLDLIQKMNSGEGVKDPTFAPGLQHLLEHPKGSHYSGDINVSRVATDIASFGSAEIVRGVADVVGHNVGGEVGKFARGVKGFAEDPIHGGSKALGRMFGLNNTLSPGATPPPTPNQLAVKNALDKSDLERRKALATNPSSTSVLGLAGDTNTKRTVLG